MRRLVRWTAERDALLRKLWAEGPTARCIGETMGVSRNAILGRAGRLGLPSRDETPRERAPRPESRKPRAGAVLAPAVIVPKDEPEPAGPLNTFPDVHGQCRFIHGTPTETEWRCCAAPVGPQYPYCPYHAARCLNPQPQKRAA